MREFTRACSSARLSQKSKSFPRTTDEAPGILHPPPPAAEAGGELRIGSGSEDDGSWESGARTGEESERTIGRLYRHEKSLSRVKITWPFLEEVGHTNAIRLERTQNQCLG